MAAAKPDAPGHPARLRRKHILRLGRPGCRSARRSRRHAGLLPCAARVLIRPRTTASAGDSHLPRRPLSIPAFSTRPVWHLPISARSVRHPDDRRSTDSEPHPRRTARGPRHLRPRHPEGRRDHRPAGHRRQAIHAARRVQPDQDLPGDRRRAAGRATARGPGTSWRRSSRTAASSTGRPSTSSEARTRTATGTTAEEPSSSTRSSGTGASSSPT